MDEFEIRPDPTTGFHGNCWVMIGKNGLSADVGVMMGKRVSPLFSAVFHPFLSTLAGNNDMHENLEELEIWLDPTTGAS